MIAKMRKPKSMNVIDLEELQHLKPCLLPSETAAVLGISRNRVWFLLRRGKLTPYPYLGAMHVLTSSVIRRLKMRAKIPARCRKLLA